MRGRDWICPGTAIVRGVALPCLTTNRAMIHLAITDHAFERARERAGWNRGALSRMLERVSYDGVAASTPCRKIREFLRHYQDESPGRFARAYGEHVFLFARDAAADTAVLVTVLPLPHELRRPAHDARHLATAA